MHNMDYARYLGRHDVHDDKRHGTTRVFAALNVFDGTVHRPQHTAPRHEEFIRFLNEINRHTPADKNIT